VGTIKRSAPANATDIEGPKQRTIAHSQLSNSAILIGDPDCQPIKGNSLWVSSTSSCKRTEDSSIARSQLRNIIRTACV